MCLSNILHYCELNHCISQVKQLLGAYFIESTETEDESTPIEDTIHDLKESLQVIIKELASKLNHLSSLNGDLQMEINVSEAIDENDTTTQSSTRPPSSAATMNILDELADREQRHKILVV